MLLAERNGAHHVAFWLQRQLYAFRGRIPAHDSHCSADQLADLVQHEALPEHHHAHPLLPLQMHTQLLSTQYSVNVLNIDSCIQSDARAASYKEPQDRP